MKTIYKYKLEVEDSQVVKMPMGAEILKVDTQRARPCLWAMVETDHILEDRIIIMRGTGHPAIGLTKENYLGSFILLGGDLVFHVFEGVKN